MTSYDFRSLSPHDFERLSTDLLQEELGHSLESFTVGPDSGIDSRLLLRSNVIVVQCKHYADSTFSRLLSTIRNQERKHIENLPTRARYILTTSMGLSPKNKDQLSKVIGSRCKSRADIYGRDDLNSLLAKHPTVERRHYKLWLTSTETLTSVMHAGIITDSISHLDDVRKRLSRYVPNPSLYRARETIDQHHFCIVSGIPGIGKTTLAEILLAHLVDKDGYAPFRVNSRIEEIRPIKDRSKKQVFYFDDFLGRTDLVHLERNEDRHLVELMREVSNNDRWRLVLTTREYILNAAKTQYEAIHQLPDSFARCVIDLADYTRPVRAQMLYNHIYFSDLPKSHKLAILEPPQRRSWREPGVFSYRDVIDHPNYVPRLIEFMTGATYTKHGDAERYIADFQANLDDPSRIWEHAFRHQISDAARRLVLVLATLPRRVHEEDARECFRELSDRWRKQYGSGTGADDWEDALRELDGSFVASSRVGQDIALQFHNPSVEDFVKKHLHRSRAGVDDLLASAIFFEQYSGLWARYRKRLASHGSIFFEQVSEFVPGRSTRVVSAETGIASCTVIEEQVRFLMRVAKDTGRDVSEAASGALDSMTTLWGRGPGSKEACLDLLLYWMQEVGDVPRTLFRTARVFLLDVDACDIDDFGISAGFVERFPDAVSEDVWVRLVDRFDEIWWDFDDVQSEDELMRILEVVERVGRVLGTDVFDVVDRINERIGELERQAEKEMDLQEAKWERSHTGGEGASIEKMFAGLRNDIARS